MDLSFNLISYWPYMKQSHVIMLSHVTLQMQTATFSKNSPNHINFHEPAIKEAVNIKKCALIFG